MESCIKNLIKKISNIDNVYQKYSSIKNKLYYKTTTQPTIMWHMGVTAINYDKFLQKGKNEILNNVDFNSLAELKNRSINEYDRLDFDEVFRFIDEKFLKLKEILLNKSEKYAKK